MQINMFMITVPLFLKALKNLKSILEKAVAESREREFEIEYLLNFRLYPDQFPLYQQIRISCLEAKNSVASLTGKKAPQLKRNGGDIEALNRYINTTLEYLESLDPNDFEDTALKPIPISFIEGKYLTGYDYMTEMVLPNFYFHVTTAYSILRHNGIALGKKDYLGELSLKDKN